MAKRKLSATWDLAKLNKLTISPIVCSGWILPLILHGFWVDELFICAGRPPFSTCSEDNLPRQLDPSIRGIWFCSTALDLVFRMRRNIIPVHKQDMMHVLVCSDFFCCSCQLHLSGAHHTELF
jgi:hypothetical protein